MVDTALLPAIREAIKQNEIGNTSPYCLAFACLGASGASFGIFQGDTNVNHTARATLAGIMQAQPIETHAITRVIGLLSQPCPHGNPLSPEDARDVNDALASDQGRSAVDAMDGNLLQVVLGELDSSISAAQSRQLTIDPIAQLYICLWVNMTGAPTTLNKWLSGEATLGLSAPAMPTVTQHQLETYLQANSYFRIHPKNFVHMQQSVSAGAALLPSPVMV